MSNNREELINALLEQIKKDQKAIYAVETQTCDREEFLNVAKRFDRLSELTRQLQKYKSSMIGFESKYGPV